MSCKLCNQFRGVGEMRTAAETLLKASRNHIKKDVLWQELQESAGVCYCCGILVRGCRGCFAQHSINEVQIESLNLIFYYFNYEEENSDIDKTISFLLNDGRFFDIEMFATDDDDCSIPDSWDFVPMSVRTSPSTDSSSAIDVIESWLLNCHEDSHDDCVSSEDPELPKRVVDVSGANGGIRLFESHGQFSKYICLSHCWGRAQIITTTTTTLQDRQKGISLSDLPQTFRDAVGLTRRLGIQYIWIDSLCIIQDDLRDWEVESAKMSAIYSNSYLTIAATKSPNGSGGLYTETPDFQVSGKTPQGEAYRVFFRERIDHHLDAILEPDRSEAGHGIISHATAVHHPLLTRAWVYQERILSPRIVHFGPHEVFMECLSDIRCECGGIAFHGSSEVAPAVMMKLLYADSMFSYAVGKEWHIYAAYYIARIWRTMVCSYTALGITRFGDRLPAIGGLAKNMAGVRKSKYIAGLWENTLNDDLVWVLFQSEQGKPPRPSPATAPTWSWASVGTHVLYWDQIYHWDPEDVVTDEERPPYQHFSLVIEWNIDPAGVDEFGQMREASIKIRGLVATGRLEREVDNQNMQQTTAYYIVFSSNTRLRMSADYHLDFEGPNQVLPGANVTCLRMSTIQEGKTEYLISLVLRPLEDKVGIFERIGALLVTALPPPVDPLGGIYSIEDEQTVEIW
ncbi:hypothetical protein QQZ08_005720 [Neonectria magnoliae]|uniref:Heterokaryon incompatibility domain-containing protein n=1 Tax=Neonectria magnoliae TaxID=2732573 RepID=A0ABR1I2Q6_9HYPO